MTCCAHAVHYVGGEAEGHQLWCVQEAALLEGHPQVNVHHLRGLAVQQNVVAVPVPQADDVTCMVCHSMTHSSSNSCCSTCRDQTATDAQSQYGHGMKEE